MKRVLIALAGVVLLAGVAGLAVAATGTGTSSGSCPSTVPAGATTVPCTLKASVNVPVPVVTKTTAGPTTTVTATVTVTPTPTPTTTPPPSGSFAPGQDMGPSNTGYAAAGLTASQLTPSGPVTYTTPGQTVTGVAYTGEVDVEADNVTIQNCSLTNGGLNAIGFLLNGNNDTVKDCTITSPAGQSMYEPIWVFGDGNTVDGVNISRGENALTTYGTHVTIQNSWLHDAALDSQPSDHPDSIEVYGGGTVTILNNRIVEGCGPPTPTCNNSSNPGMFDSPINVAPYNSYKVQGLTIKGNFLDNGQGDTLIDNQNPSCTGASGDCLINVVVEDNAFGGHQCPATNPQCIGIFTDLENYEQRPDVQTAADQALNPNALLWPTSGPDVNRWEESADIETSTTPHDGDIVIPSPN